MLKRDKTNASDFSTSEDRLRVVTLCYRYAYLRQRQPTLSRAERIIWGVLQRTLEGDPDRKRRQHRRMQLGAPASIRVRGIAIPALISDISGGGMYLQSDVTLPVGSRVEVRVGRGGDTEYIFGCTVERRDDRGLGLSYRGAPLELRRGPHQRAA